MKEVLQEWFQRNFSDPQAVILAMMLLIGLTMVILIGDILAPFLASIIIAYLLEGLIHKLYWLKIRRMFLVLIVSFLFVVTLLALVLGLIPMLSRQVAQLFRELPTMLTQGQEDLMQLPAQYPTLISEVQVQEIIEALRLQLLEKGQSIFAQGLSALPDIFSLLIYLILVPFLVFFMLKDKDKILGWFQAYLPRRRELVDRVWREMDAQLGNYVRGKFLEIFIVGVVSIVVFALLGLNYAVLLGALVGLSVLIPYVGAAMVTIPVVTIGVLQWGNVPEFWYLVVAYTVIQALDGNVLVPVLFGDMVNLHPLAIIVAVLFFGGIWGLWGIFFAIPLATLVMAVLNAWPRNLASEQPS